MSLPNTELFVADAELRVVALFADRRDASFAAGIFAEAAIPFVAVPDIRSLCDEARAGAGTLLVTDESLNREALQCLSEVLELQGPWSEIPIIVFLSAGLDCPFVEEVLLLSAEVILLDLPVRSHSLVAVVRSALKSRKRQYLVRRQMAEIAGREREIRRQAGILDMTYDGIIVWGEGDRISFWNTGAADLYGFPRKEALGRPIHDLLRTEFPEPLAEIRAELETKGRWQGKLRQRTRSGDRVTVLSRWSFHRDDGSFNVVEVNTDITSREKAEQRAEQSRILLQKIMDAAPVPVAYFDRERTILLANRAYLDMLGKSEEEVLGRPTNEVLPEEVLRQIQPNLEEALQGETVRFEMEVRQPLTGVVRKYIKACVPDVTADGTVLGIISAHNDITDIKESEQRMQAAKEVAEGANRAKTEFLANMSHEMRTPLAAVLGMLQLVLEMEIGDEERDLLQTALRSGESLLRLITDLLDFARLEAGRLPFDNKEFSVTSCVSSAVDVVAMDARKKGLSLRVEIDERTPPVIMGDEGRVRQVLVNLLGNAVKFTERGEIVVTVTARAGEGAGGRDSIEFSVRDTGIGIPPQMAEKLFEKFTQADASSTRRYGGSGLGLALSKEIVERMGGTIRVSSTPGVGSDFVFTIPVDVPATND